MKIQLVDLKSQYEGIKPEIDGAIYSIIESSSFIMGKPVKEFETSLAKSCTTDKQVYALGVSSGTSAIFLALKAYGIGPGDEVITVPNSFIATAEAILHCGAKPVFVDVDPTTMLMDANALESKIGSSTKGILPVHLYGQCPDMSQISRIAERYSLHVIEDAAQAINTAYKSKKLPIHETAALSFFPSKNLGCYGDGGAVLTTNENVASVVAKLRDHGRIDKYNSDVVGYGERLDGMQAAILSAKLPHLDRWTEQRRENARLYDYFLQGITELKLPVEASHNKHVYYVYVIRAKDRDGLASHLETNGVSSGIHYPIPLHLQGALKDLGFSSGDFPVAENASREILSLPMYPELSREQIIYVARKVRQFYDK